MGPACWFWEKDRGPQYQMPEEISQQLVPADSPSRGGDVAVYVFDINQRSLPGELLLICSCVCFCLYGPFCCISFHKFSRQLSTFSLFSSGLINTLLVLSTTYLLTTVSFSPDIIPCGWLGSKHQLTYYFWRTDMWETWPSSLVALSSLHRRKMYPTKKIRTKCRSHWTTNVVVVVFCLFF